jgi:enoyl-CoA hydratase
MTDDADLGVSPETLDVNLHGRVEGLLTIVFDRPEVYNALSEQLQADLMDVLAAAETRDDVRVVVITGSEESGTFASGADISDFPETTAIEKREISRGRRFVEAVDEFPQPVLASIDGYALGGACELIQACDIRIATTDAVFGHPEIDLGLFPGAGGTQRLPRLVGEGQAMRIILTGEHIEAEEAHRMGLVDILCDPDDLRDRTDEVAASIASKSPVAVEAAKRSIRQASRMPLDAGLTYEKELFALVFSSEDSQEGVAAFLEDRDPEWRGK